MLPDGQGVKLLTNENMTFEGRKANATLIAAAPDMLEAIITVVNLETELSFDALCILKDAIRKARGEK